MCASIHVFFCVCIHVCFCACSLLWMCAFIHVRFCVVSLCMYTFVDVWMWASVHVSFQWMVLPQFVWGECHGNHNTCKRDTPWWGWWGGPRAWDAGKKDALSHFWSHAAKERDKYPNLSLQGRTRFPNLVTLKMPLVGRGKKDALSHFCISLAMPPKRTRRKP